MSLQKKDCQKEIEKLSGAENEKDQHVVGHNWRVSRLVVGVASYLGWPKEEIRFAKLGGMLHDIGKIALSHGILLKKRRLSKEEIQVMRGHPDIGAKMIMRVDGLEPVIPYALSHHESWSGGGYPYGLSGEDIPEKGRLLAVCDAFDAMITPRPYSKGLLTEMAVEELIHQKGKQFDPAFVEAFVISWQSGKIRDIWGDNEGEPFDNFSPLGKTIYHLFSEGISVEDTAKLLNIDTSYVESCCRNEIMDKPQAQIMIRINDEKSMLELGPRLICQQSAPEFL